VNRRTVGIEGGAHIPGPGRSRRRSQRSAPRVDRLQTLYGIWIRQRVKICLRIRIRLIPTKMLIIPNLANKPNQAPQQTKPPNSRRPKQYDSALESPLIVFGFLGLFILLVLIIILIIVLIIA
jgi:hypothetical protein